MMTREARAVGLKESRGPEEAVVEVGLLLSGQQLAALEAAAHQRGLTAGGLVRHLIREFLGAASAEESQCRGR
jgi:hypothetical protein